MDLGRADRSSSHGLPFPTGASDLIEDLHRRQRKRKKQRIIRWVVLAVVTIITIIAVKYFADERTRAAALADAWTTAQNGALHDYQRAIDVVDASLIQDPNHGETLATRALLLTRRWLEFGVDEPAARAAIDGAPSGATPTELAAAMVKLAESDAAAAEEQLDDADPDAEELQAQGLWLAANIALANAHDENVVRAALDRLATRLEEQPTVPLHRVHATLSMVLGETEAAFAELEAARKLYPEHLGLSADEALYYASMHEHLAGVNSVVRKLVATPSLSPRDRAHLQLAQSVVEVRSGESKKALAELDKAWPDLAAWNQMTRRLAIETALEAGDASRPDRWLKDSTFAEKDTEIYRAWARLVEGNVIASLEKLAQLPQEDPYVGLLQALALTEQQRFAEAKPWLERAGKLLPGRQDVAVAHARVDLRLGDKQSALEHLKQLAEEEAFAPRAWTGLGEAYRMMGESAGKSAEKDAERALRRAIEREPAPAEAMLQLAMLLNERRRRDAKAELAALELLENAAATNPHLPRYREQLALFEADFGRTEKAIEALHGLMAEPSVSPETVLALVRLEAEGGNVDANYSVLLAKAGERGADPRDLARAQARLDLLKAGRDPAALEAVRRKLEGLVNQQPADVDSRLLLAQCWQSIGNREEVEATLNRGLRATPGQYQGRLFLMRARMDARTGDRSAAARANTAWKKMLIEDRPPIELLDVAEFAATQWARQKKDGFAMQVVRRLTERLEHSSDAWSVRAEIELLAADASDARQSAERAIKLDDSNPRAHLALGRAYLRYGMKPEARKEHERAIELAKGTPQEERYREALRKL